MAMSSAFVALVGRVSMLLALGFGQRLGTVEPLVEVRIQVMDLMC